jgi:hypothetical protein
MEGEELELFERSLRHATEQHTGAALDGALDELGWADALVDDRRAAVSLLFELQGATLATSSALELVLLDALGLDAADRPGVVLPPVGTWSAPGRVDAKGFAVQGLGLASIVGRDRVVVVVVDPDSKERAASVASGTLTARPLRGLDPALGLVELSAADLPGDLAEREPTRDWTAAVALARIALAHELVGASRTMLALAREHALERIQFDRPIASFQAVRHRLAETLVAIETADAVLDAAWLDGSPITAAMAKSVAGRSARTTARHCQQVMAGIGFTTEHPFQRLVRRVLVLDELFGSSRVLTRRLGDDLLASRQLPPLLPL